MNRKLKFFQAINEALDLCLAGDPNVYLIGLGVPDPKGVFGTTLGLQQKYGSARVMDMPASENGMTGVVIGSALAGMRPIITHQRMDFALLSVDQMVNQAANWHYMFGGKMSVPLVIRMLIGRGWGQGPQHSQSFQAWFSHIPGLKVIMPTTAYDAKGLLISAIEDNNPVIFIEHRWLYNLIDVVPEGIYRVPLGKARVVKEGKDITMVATSYMTIETLRAAEMLLRDNISAEVIDIRSLKPLDENLILESVRKTGRFLVADTGWKSFGIGSEIVARVAEEALSDLKCPPVRVALPDCPAPTSPALSRYYYPGAEQIIFLTRKMIGLVDKEPFITEGKTVLLDIPDDTFTGPF